MKQLIDEMKVGLSTVFAFYLKAHFFHWNVEGIHFQELHSLFETIYSEVYGAVDDFAEKIRSLGGYAPGSNSRFSVLSQIDDAVEVIPPEAMIQELLQDAENMVTVLKRVYDMAEAAGEHGFSNFLAERMDAFRKHAWMLRATAK
jgi:starvation-inducible DNA-binding protein